MTRCSPYVMLDDGMIHDNDGNIVVVVVPAVAAVVVVVGVVVELSTIMEERSLLLEDRMKNNIITTVVVVDVTILRPHLPHIVAIWREYNRTGIITILMDSPDKSVKLGS